MARLKGKRASLPVSLSSSSSSSSSSHDGQSAASPLLFGLCVLLIFACLPVIFLHRDANERHDMLEISASIDKLEKDHKALVQMIGTLETNAVHAVEELSAGAASVGLRPKQITNVPAGVLPQQPQVSPPVTTVSTQQPPSVNEASGDTDAPAPITFNTPSAATSEAVLVVGGTDGSGTRRVVQILTQLGVTMVSEDPETFDIHADSVGGWPTIVSPVIERTRSLAYDPATLPAPLQTRMKSALGQLLQIAEADSHKPTSHVLAKGGALPKPNGVGARRVKYGFKAPVAMTLAPYWAHLLPHFRLLHVLRDGRDIAFSANQGPVEKFYVSMYGGVPDRNEVKAVRLWSDWNAQLKKWAQERVDGFDRVSGNAGKSFGYFALHTEDLVDDSRDVRYAAIAHLAAWVGSDISPKEMCCMAVRGSQFMGSHDRTENVPLNNLKKRYGKWRTVLAADLNLKRRLEEVGAAGLREFGYEPVRTMAGSGGSGARVGGHVCALEPSECGIVKADEASRDKENPASWSIPGVCSVRADVDYRGGDIESASIAGPDGGTVDKTLCCQRCRDTPGCRHFTVDVVHGVCYLKHSKGTETATDGLGKHLVSGDMVKA